MGHTAKGEWYLLATMAERMGVKQLRDTLTATIRRVRAGETIEVTHQDVVVAVLSPVDNDRISRLVASGEVALPTEPMGPFRLHPVTGPMSASEAIEEDRAESR